MRTKKIAIFASGTGSNAINLIQYFKGNPSLEIVFVLSNKEDATVIESASKLGIQTICCSNKQASDASYMIQTCEDYKVDFIVLAGYLRLIPAALIDRFADRIINLHPSLLPKYGGKGMYGHHVHEAVLENQETESGITIHIVNEEFDKGRIIAQFKFKIDDGFELADIQREISRLEQLRLPVVVEGEVLRLKV